MLFKIKSEAQGETEKCGFILFNTIRFKNITDMIDYI